MAHAWLSPSGAPAWLACQLKPWAEKGIPNESSPASSEGTCAHELSEMCLNDRTDAQQLIGLVLESDGRHFGVDDDMAGYVQLYIDYVRAIPGVLMVEENLLIEEITGEAGATGTADAVILSGRTLHVIDLKYGQGVFVESKNNAQLRMYGLAAYMAYSWIVDVDTIVMHIVQPRMDNIDSETMSAADLVAWGEEVRAVADRITAGPELLTAVAGEKQCKFCRAKASCPALQSHVMTVVMQEFDDLTVEDTVHSKLQDALDRIARVDNASLAAIMPNLDMVIDWCKSVRAEVERRVFDGQTIDGFKVVDGKRGARSWTDEEPARLALAGHGVPREKYITEKMITPTQAQKILKDRPVVWAALQPLISQADGKPAVVSTRDKRTALVVDDPANFFEILGD